MGGVLAIPFQEAGWRSGVDGEGCRCPGEARGDEAGNEALWSPQRQGRRSDRCEWV